MNLLFVCCATFVCRIADNATDPQNIPPTVTLADILQGQPERPATPVPPAAATPGASSSTGGPPVLQIVLPVILGIAVLAGLGLVGFRMIKIRRAGRVVAAAPAPPTLPGMNARGMLGKQTQPGKAKHCSSCVLHHVPASTVTLHVC